MRNMSNNPVNQLPEDSQIWEHLKQAISTSSGFKRWQLERNLDGRLASQGLDLQVHQFLRDTLETLAY